MNVQSASMIAWVTVVLPLGMTQAADVQEDGGNDSRLSIDALEESETERSVTRETEPSGPDGEPAGTARDVTQRVREQIYILRHHRVFCRNDQWAAAIRELAEIGKPAVPELVAELDRTNRDQTLRALGFTLRAIGDPRAVPGLIRAIPKLLRGRGSDCGVSVLDPDVWAFMKQHERHPDDDDSVGYGRPVNEILDALTKITGHHEPPEGQRDKLRHVFWGGSEEQQAEKRRMFAERMEHWRQWWSEHQEEFVSKEELLPVQTARPEGDLVQEAGLARFGPLFPTGDTVRLGAVREVRLEPTAFWNAKSYIDFDTGRVFEQYEGNSEAAAKGFAHWVVQNGIDARGIDGRDLHTWLIPNERWDTLEEEVWSGQSLKLVREARSTLVPFGKSRWDYQRDQVGTFLFTTREGGRGVVQVFPRAEGSQVRRLRYRMWLDQETTHAKPSIATPRKPPGVALGPMIAATLQTPARGRTFLLDLETGRTVSPPDSLIPPDASPTFAYYRNAEFVAWCREHEIDIVTNESKVAYMGGAPSGRSSRPNRIVQLVGLGMVARRVLPGSFDEMSIEEVQDILNRRPEEKSEMAWMSPQSGTANRPDTFVIKTRGGNVGLLQIVKSSSLLQFAMIRYRISGNGPDAPTNRGADEVDSPSP